MTDRTPEIIKRAIAARTAAGLKLTFIIPDRAEPFTCFPSSEAIKATWIANAARKGWTQVS